MTAVIAVIAVGVAGSAVYRIGGSGSKAAWSGQVSSTPVQRPDRPRH